MRFSLILIGFVGVAVILPAGIYAVEPRDYEEALKSDAAVESSDGQETSTEYPNGINVIPGQPDIHYPIYDRIPKSVFSCSGRIPGFYADTDLRCQVWHICDEGGIQQSFLCTNGTIYSQDKRVCDWWYNVNCDPEEVSRNYEANKELYKEPKKKYEEAESNDLPPPPSVPSKKPVPRGPAQTNFAQSPSRPAEYSTKPVAQPSQRPRPHPQEVRPSQNTPEPQQYRSPPPQQQYSSPAPQPSPRSNSQSAPQPQQFRQPTSQQPPLQVRSQSQGVQYRPVPQEQQRQPTSQQRTPQNYSPSRPQQQERDDGVQLVPAPSSNYYEAPTPRRQPAPVQQVNDVKQYETSRSSQQQSTTPTPVPEKKRVIVLRLPGPLPPGATIPPHILMEYAESVLAAERAGKAPPAGLVSHKTVPLNSAPATRPPPPPPPTTTLAPQTQQPPKAAHSRPTPRGPIVPYTPRPFNLFLEDAVRFNGQSKVKPSQPQPQQPLRQTQVEQRQPTQAPVQKETPAPQQYRAQPSQVRPSQVQPEQQQQQYRPQPREERPPQQQQYRPQQREDRPNPQPQQQYRTAPSPQRVPQNQQNEERTYEEPTNRPPPPPPPSSKKPVPPQKPSYNPKTAALAGPSYEKKFRHSTPRKYGDVKFAPRSAAAAVDDFETSPEESRRPAYFNNLQHVPYLSSDVPSSTSRPRTSKLKESFEQEKLSSFIPEEEREIETVDPAVRKLAVSAGLKVKDPRNNRNRPTPEARPNQGDYESTRLIVARTSTTTTSTPLPVEEPSSTTQKVAMRRVIRKKVRKNKQQQQEPQPPTTSEPIVEADFSRRRTTLAEPNTTTIRRTTTIRTTTKTTPPPPPPTQRPQVAEEEDNDYVDYYNGRAAKNYGFDIYGRTDHEDEEEELEKAAQEYYRASEQFGSRF